VDFGLVDTIFWIAALLQMPLLLIWLTFVLYLVFLTLTAVVGRVREGKATGFASKPTTRFSILVPAHDEELVIAECLDSLLAIDYPRTRMRIIVIADNCTDNTARIVRSKRVTLYERFDAELRGKGHALDWAIKRLLGGDGGWTDAVVVFDADTQVDRQFLRQMDSKLRDGDLDLQGQYNLLDPFYNWRTALLYSALLLHNRLRPLARQTLGWSTLLKGNGMCFSRAVVERFGWNAYSLAEDIEYTTTLLQAGIRVEPAPGAVIYAQAAQTSHQATSQRLRWEGGRFALAKRDGLQMLREFSRHGSTAKLDWAMDLLTPPMAILIGVPVLMLVLNIPLLLMESGASAALSWTWLGVLLGACIYIIGGLLISGAESRAYAYLLCTPLFLVWKLKIYGTMLLGRGPRGWVRTERSTTSWPTFQR
jgi:cellulose synthase/poly-beta-1,6-N-acetylglucosamine synthase-like glycosyltransferase